MKWIHPPADNADDDEQKITCHADVIETFRGASKKTISFVMYTENKEDPGFCNTPFIITLCKSNETYYWPGTGAVFSADPRLIDLAKKIGRAADNTQLTFEDCDW